MKQLEIVLSTADILHIKFNSKGGLSIIFAPFDYRNQKTTISIDKQDVKKLLDFLKKELP